jgi:HK97 family phage major capsid protein
MADEIKGLIEAQGKAFEEFKSTLDSMKQHDAVTDEKLSKIEGELDRAIEAKAAIEASMAAERKEREELELRLSRRGSTATDEKLALEIKEHANALGRADVSEDEFNAYKSGLATYLRKGEKLVGVDEFKAMSVGGDPDGGYLVTPDVSGRIVMKVYETSPIRQIASSVSISTDSIEGIEDLDEAASGWVGETSTRSDTATPQVGRYKIEAHELYAQPKITQKLLDDASVNVEAWLSGKVAEHIARTENAAFVAGDGVGKPKGLTDYTTAADSGSGVTWGTIGHVKSGKNGAFADANPIDKLFDLIGTVKEAYLSNARFLTRRSVITELRKIKDGEGRYYWQPSLLAGQPETFAAYPITRAEDMPALATGSVSLMFGNFSEAYLVVDRIGIRTLRDPYTDKPYVKFYTTKRVGGGVVNFEAIKAMKFSA